MKGWTNDKDRRKFNSYSFEAEPRRRRRAVRRGRDACNRGAGAAAGASDALEEITVTARKRSENLQDVPQSIDVFTSKDLENLQISRFEDYAMKSPSISFISTDRRRRCSSCAAYPMAAIPMS